MENKEESDTQSLINKKICLEVETENNYEDGQKIIDLSTVCKCICKISIINQEKQKIGSGFFCFLPFKNIHLKTLITNFHVISDQEVNKKIEIEISHKDIKNTTIKEKIVLNKKERHIFQLNEDSGDITAIEILNSDQIANEYFLEVDDNYLNPKKYNKKEIMVFQYPLGTILQYSKGKILEINGDSLVYNASTNKGSSGGAIVLESSLKLIGVHFGGISIEKKNYGTIIKKIIEEIEKKNFTPHFEVKFTNKVKIIDKEYNEINKEEIKCYFIKRRVYRVAILVLILISYLIYKIISKISSQKKKILKRKKKYDSLKSIILEFEKNCSDIEEMLMRETTKNKEKAEDYQRLIIKDNIKPYKKEKSFFPRIGEFFSGKPNGLGIIEYKNSKYYGEIKDGLRHGIGMMTKNNKQIKEEEYVGEYKNDIRSGFGTLTYINGDVCEGNFTANNLIGIRKCYYSKEGSFYIGEYENDYRDGIGKYIWKDGHYFVGLWKENNYTKGLFYYPNNGTILDVKKPFDYYGKKKSKGKYYYSNGTIIKAVSVNYDEWAPQTQKDNPRKVSME